MEISVVVLVGPHDERKNKQVLQESKDAGPKVGDFRHELAL